MRAKNGKIQLYWHKATHHRCVKTDACMIMMKLLLWCTNTSSPIFGSLFYEFLCRFEHSRFRMKIMELDGSLVDFEISLLIYKRTFSLLITDFYTRKFLMSNQWWKLYTIPQIQFTKQLDFEWWIFGMNGMKIVVTVICTTRQNWMNIPIMTAVMSKKYSIISCVGPSYCCANFFFLFSHCWAKI